MRQKKYQTPSIASLLFATLESGRSVRRFRDILREEEWANYKKESVRTEFSRLHRKNFISKNQKEWRMTEIGKKYADQIKLLSFIPSPFNSKTPINTILSFDIPERNRIKRNWLRNQIKIFGYKMLQQSLWVGPGPLPDEFMKRLENLEIKNRIKIFKIKDKK